MSTPRTVLVTGAAGYIGSHAVLALRQAGYRVVALDNLSTGRRSAVPDEVPFVYGSVGDKVLLRQILAVHNISAVLHFAGSIVSVESLSQPLCYYENNTCASQVLIATCVEFGVKHFIFSSTACVYGNPKIVPVTVDAPTLPTTPYGSSKLVTEWILRDAAAVSDLRYVSLRYFNVAGADPECRAGQLSRKPTHLIEIALQAATGERDCVEIFGGDYPTADGTCIRDYVHVTDLVEAHLAALCWLETSGPSVTFNLGNGEGFSVREVIKAVESVVGHAIRVRFAPRRPGDVPRLVADWKPAQRILGWRPKRQALKTQIEDAWRWYRSQVTRDDRS